MAAALLTFTSVTGAQAPPKPPAAPPAKAPEQAQPPAQAKPDAAAAPKQAQGKEGKADGAASEPPAATVSNQAQGSCPPKAFCQHADVGPPQQPAAQHADGSEQDGGAAADGEAGGPVGQGEQDGLASESTGWAPEGEDGWLASEDPNWRREEEDSGMGAVTTGGLVIFGVGYGPAFLVGLIAAVIEDSDDGDASESEVLLPLLLPVAGPPITGALTDASTEVWTVLMVDSAIQAAGLIMLGVGIALDNADDSGKVARPQVFPHVGRTKTGATTLGIMGTF